MQQDREQDSATSIVVECELAAPPEKVWRALTEPEILARWLMPNDMRAEPGQRFQLRPTNGNGAVGRGPIECEIIAAEPNRKLSYSWRGPADERDADGRRLDTVVTFLLSEIAGGTRLRVIHSGFPQARHFVRDGRSTMCAANRNLPVHTRLAA